MARFDVLMCLAREKNPDGGSTLIMEVEGTEYSHALCLFKDRDGAWKVFHSDGQKTCIIMADDFMADHDLPFAYWLPLDCTEDEFIDYVHGESGKNVGYSKGQLIVNQGLRILGIKWTPWRNRNKQRICCEEMYLIARRSPIAWDLQEAYDQDAIGLREWQEYLAKSPWTRREFNPWPRPA